GACNGGSGVRRGSSRWIQNWRNGSKYVGSSTYACAPRVCANVPNWLKIDTRVASVLTRYPRSHNHSAYRSMGGPIQDDRIRSSVSGRTKQRSSMNTLLAPLALDDCPPKRVARYVAATCFQVFRISLRK